MSNEELISNELNSVVSDNEKRIRTQDLYELLKSRLEPKMELLEFRALVKSLISSKKLGEFKLVKGRYGGIYRSDATGAGTSVFVSADNKESEEDSSEATTSINAEDESKIEDESSDRAGTTINLSNSVRIHATDSRNWAIQKKVGDIWLSKFYYSTLDLSIEGLARHILDESFKFKNVEIKQLKEIVELINSVKSDLISAIKESHVSL